MRFLPSSLLFVFVNAFIATVFADADQLRLHRNMWIAAGVDAYEYGYNKFCECHGDSPPETLVTVRDDQVQDVRHIPANSTREVPAEPRNFGLYWTVDEMFALLEAALARNAVVRADYDSELGFPTRVYIDYDRELIGDEVDIRITRFVRQGG